MDEEEELYFAEEDRTETIDLAAEDDEEYEEGFGEEGNYSDD
ncbi:MAG: hypothetical protein ACMXYD_04635 [Candidatus Woesearchaeota archaeon]